ncbi:hypothetical protein B0H14DRAFT_2619943 [Mycena olivaceomarginata]|nr:hypothetical protein B0H14DRAFT_2619943 [Mycena olivaceomarginata]
MSATLVACSCWWHDMCPASFFAVTAFLMDVLFGSPRLRFSRAQQKSVLSWAKELGAQVPSYNGFRQTQDAPLTEVGNPTETLKVLQSEVRAKCINVSNMLGHVANTYKDVSDTYPGRVRPPVTTKRQQLGRGNVWYLNEIGDSIKKDMSNPFTRSGMALYLDDTGNKLENGVIYYVNKPLQCSDGSWFLPKHWLTSDGGKVIFCVTERDDGSLVVQDETRELVEVSTFQFNILQILERTSRIYPLAGTPNYPYHLPIIQL